MGGGAAGSGVATAAGVLLGLLARSMAPAADGNVNWLVGTLKTIGSSYVKLLTVAVVPLALLSVPLGLTEMGDEVAASLGVHSGAIRRRAVVLSVLLAGGAVAVAGPIAFVALTAPHITRLLARSARPLLGLSAVTGALLLSAADLATQQVPIFDGLPVGILTLAIGGVYLGALLVGEWKKAS